MVLLTAGQALGRKAPDFRLPSTDGRIITLNDVAGTGGTVVAFICNHCPYVKTSIDRIVADARSLQGEGVGFVAICSNDEAEYPEDSFVNMIKFAERNRFPFPYLQDVSQEVARAYDAVCTPDYFGLDRAGAVRYRGRLDEGRPGLTPAPNARRDLFLAMRQIVHTGRGPEQQTPSIGCSIKWKD